MEPGSEIFQYLQKMGTIFAVFDGHTQDSGNISYGVQVGAQRFFVKTAGAQDAEVYLAHAARVDLLRNAAKLAHSVADHPAAQKTLPRLRHVVETLAGPLLFYDWINGRLLHPRQQDTEAHQLFKALPASEITQALTDIYAVHAALAEAGWVAVDYYDGSLMYDFAQKQIYLVDLDHYHQGPFENEMGRMFGSSRFMAPEEFQLGALIDQRTTVFAMGRTAAVFLGEPGEPGFSGSAAQRAVIQQACQPDPAVRFSSVRAFYAAWLTASPPAA